MQSWLQVQSPKDFILLLVPLWCGRKGNDVQTKMLRSDENPPEGKFLISIPNGYQ